MEKSYKKFIKQIRNKDFFIKYFILIISCAVLAINYNVILLNNDIVIGGTSGVAILIKNFIDPSKFILIVNVILLIIGLITLGKVEFKNALIGSILFPLMIKFLDPLTSYLTPYLTFDNIIVTLLVSSLLYGISCGFIYKHGFSTGGFDIILNICSKYLHIPTGKANLFVNGIILIIAGAKLGVNNMIYGIIIVYLGSTLIDKIMIGISDSKQFLIHTKKVDVIKDFIIGELNCGVTLLEAKGGYLKDNKEIIMCVVANKDYYFFKNVLVKIDPEVFFVISDCYEVTGGVKRTNLPFI